ncbi:MAG: TOBE domain-containing protein [Promethearchaeota archaeon]
MSSKVQSNKEKRDKELEEVAENDNSTLLKISPKFRLWLELEDKSLDEEDKALLGKGGALLLKKISETGSISDAIRDVPPKHGSSKKTGLSYRYAWGLLRKISNRLKKPIIRKFRGGLKGGGSELTQTGEELLRHYTRLENLIQGTLAESGVAWEAISLKLLDTNRLEGKVVSVMRDPIAAKVKIELRVPTIIDSLITAEAVDDLNLKEGDTVKAIIKATEIYLSVM